MIRYTPYVPSTVRPGRPCPMCKDEATVTETQGVYLAFASCSRCGWQTSDWHGDDGTLNARWAAYAGQGWPA